MKCGKYINVTMSDNQDTPENLDIKVVDGKRYLRHPDEGLTPINRNK